MGTVWIGVEKDFRLFLFSKAEFETIYFEITISIEIQFSIQIKPRFSTTTFILTNQNLIPLDPKAIWILTFSFFLNQGFYTFFI